MSTKDIIYLALLLFISMFGRIVFKKLKRPFQLLVLLIAVTFLSECITRILVKSIRNSNPAYHFFNIAEIIFYSLIYKQLLQARWAQRLLTIVAVAISLFALVNLFFIQPLMTFPSNVILTSYCIICLFALLYFSQMLQIPSQVNILKLETFWLNALIVLYCSFSFITLAFHNYMSEHGINGDLINSIAYYLNLVVYAGMGITIFMNYQNNRTTSAAWTALK